MDSCPRVPDQTMGDHRWSDTIEMTAVSRCADLAKDSVGTLSSLDQGWTSGSGASWDVIGKDEKKASTRSRSWTSQDTSGDNWTCCGSSSCKGPSECQKAWVAPVDTALAGIEPRSELDGIFLSLSSIGGPATVSQDVSADGYAPWATAMGRNAT